MVSPKAAKLPVSGKKGCLARNRLSRNAHELMGSVRLMPRLKRIKYERLYLPDKGTAGGIISPKLQLLTGHAEEKSLAIYRDLALADVSGKYSAVLKSGNKPLRGPGLTEVLPCSFTAEDEFFGL
jgi:hypothetical protein